MSAFCFVCLTFFWRYRHKLQNGYTWFCHIWPQTCKRHDLETWKPCPYCINLKFTQKNNNKKTEKTQQQHKIQNKFLDDVFHSVQSFRCILSLICKESWNLVERICDSHHLKVWCDSHHLKIWARTVYADLTGLCLHTTSTFKQQMCVYCQLVLFFCYSSFWLLCAATGSGMIMMNTLSTLS